MKGGIFRYNRRIQKAENMLFSKIAPSLVLVLGLSAASPPSAFAFDPDLHGKYTEAAFTLYREHCQPAPPSGAVESVVKGVQAEDSATLTRAGNWHFYNRDGRVRKAWWGPERNLDAVFRQRIQELEGRLETRDPNPSEVYKAAGRVLHYIQDMSVPAHVVPIYHGPGLKDRFDGYPPAAGDALRNAVHEALGRDLAAGGCERLRPGHGEGSADFFPSLLDNTAQTTLRAIGQTDHPDAGSERWLKFWDSSRNPKGFAKYGPCSFKAGVHPETCGGVDNAALDRFYQARYQRTLEDTVRVLLYLEGRVPRQQ
jgi:hypothetical protein